MTPIYIIEWDVDTD